MNVQTLTPSLMIVRKMLIVSICVAHTLAVARKDLPICRVIPFFRDVFVRPNWLAVKSVIIMAHVIPEVTIKCYVNASIGMPATIVTLIWKVRFELKSVLRQLLEALLLPLHVRDKQIILIWHCKVTISVALRPTRHCLETNAFILSDADCSNHRWIDFVHIAAYLFNYDLLQAQATK